MSERMNLPPQQASRQRQTAPAHAPGPGAAAATDHHMANADDNARPQAATLDEIPGVDEPHRFCHPCTQKRWLDCDLYDRQQNEKLGEGHPNFRPDFLPPCFGCGQCGGGKCNCYTTSRTMRQSLHQVMGRFAPHPVTEPKPREVNPMPAHMIPPGWAGPDFAQPPRLPRDVLQNPLAVLGAPRQPSHLRQQNPQQQRQQRQQPRLGHYGQPVPPPAQFNFAAPTPTAFPTPEEYAALPPGFKMTIDPNGTRHVQRIADDPGYGAGYANTGRGVQDQGRGRGMGRGRGRGEGINLYPHGERLQSNRPPQPRPLDPYDDRPPPAQRRRIDFEAERALPSRPLQPPPPPLRTAVAPHAPAQPGASMTDNEQEDWPSDDEGGVKL